MQEPFWITKEAALAMHERQLAEHGGISGIRDNGLLESALASPQNLFIYSDAPVSIPHMAASLAYGIATNHPFLDGNKRTALSTSQTFLLLNGYEFSGSYEDEYAVFYKLAAGDLTEDALSDWFEKNSRKI